VKRPRIVLLLPRRGDPARAEAYSADLLPNELLQVAAGPAAEGYEVVLIDAMVDHDYERRLLEACEGALCVGMSAILGFQVTDGQRAAQAVRARHPGLPIIWGGWFPTVVPELYLAEGIADAVVLGQGERTFMEVVSALESGVDLEAVAGLALWREGSLVHTEPRAVLGFKHLPPTPWDLLDFESYAVEQAKPQRYKIRHGMPLGERWTEARAPRGLSHFSSFGCPTNCTFCCSPGVTGRRWKAMSGEALAAEVAELDGRFGLDTLRFQDANWGVSEKRAREFCVGLLERDVHLHWNATIEIEAVLRYSDETLDLLAESGCHLLWLGAEAGSRETQERIAKFIDVERIPEALARLTKRGITAGTFWIIGYPGESEASMRATLAAAARVKHLFPGSGSEVYPFRAVPGTSDWRLALERGWSAPSSFADWGRCFEWKWNSEHTPLPPAVRKRWSRYTQTAALYDRHVQEGPPWLRDLLARVAGWRLAGQRYGLPVEQKLFDAYVRLSAQATPGAAER
jgi:radical SAM superfamily enzyme YgiQ (UPF0313 family)